MVLPVSGVETKPVARRQPDIVEDACSVEEGCITCGDVALPLTVLAIDEGRGLALCEDEHGRRETVETALVLPVAAGDQLLVHAATALTNLSRQSQPPAGIAGDPASGTPEAIAANLAPGTPGREAEEVPG